MRTTENFYRRNPLAALNGMIGLSLEERGVYNVVIDLLYSTWRPIEDSRPFIANWCGCAVQKLNPILNRLIERGKLIRFEDGAAWYLTDAKFEEERTAVKGAKAPKKARAEQPETPAEVGGSQGNVGEKSAGVRENPGLLDTDNEENQGVTALEKSRIDENRKEPPLPPEGGGPDLFGEEGGRPAEPEPPPPDEVRVAYDAWNETARACDLPLAKDLTEARRKAIRKRLETGGLPGWREALAAVSVSRLCRGLRPGRDWKADLDFVCQAKSFTRLREGFYGKDIDPPAAVVPMPAQGPDDIWRRRVSRYLNGSRYWDDMAWGPAPGRDGCQVPAPIIEEFAASGAAEGRASA